MYEFLKKSALAIGLATLCFNAISQGLPSDKTIRIIVPYVAGGTSDILGRMLAQNLSDRLGKTVIVENKAGAGGSIGTEATVRATPDGTTILLHSGAIATEPALKKSLPYDVEKDLVAVTTAVKGPFALLVSNETPAQNVKELIAYAKANPAKLNFGTPGIGTSVHLASEQFKVAAGIDINHIPYKGASAALQALLGNEVQIVVDPLATAKQLAQSGKVRALAVTTVKRSELWPEMSTVSAQALPGFDSSVWYGLYVPAKTSPQVVKQLNEAFVEILKSPKMVQWLSEKGLEPVADTPAQAKKWLTDDIAEWKKVVKAADIEQQ
ncbi:tripartite tricarboxylate transporter substrate binding protein [Orrella sp. NBD-18]|uniref:Tripartite tricarboxylate transporter substrate binding protein n=1 Tax=Sheuella amnicola TaxID=2707330 RepID=A0A6B2R4W1_9BURK|nr:tripartite tricarboxylate transporter substrate binding protein [Sheuella amnicola]NDY84107.1 tripartite tricarboxylate transporter substrate binding protein [Sheuella amnicola]HBI83615.1 tripartite tricarboxylate transporter substrate binding protein [Alcaligenaceae bacterium]